MRILDPELQAHIDQSITTLATCWMIILRDSTIQGFTSHDQDLTFAGITFRSSGVSQTDVSSRMGIGTDNLEVHGLFNAEPIESINSKQYDSAEVNIFEVNYNALPTAITSSSVLWIKSGIVGDVFLKQGSWVLEIRGYMQMLKQEIGVKTSALCRAEFGDADCRADLEQFKKIGTVVSIDRRIIITDISGLDPNDMRSGRLDVISKKISFDIVSSNENVFILSETPILDITGMSISATMGCNKSLQDCDRRFNNVANYFGEPYVPTSDEWAAGFNKTVSV